MTGSYEKIKPHLPVGSEQAPGRICHGWMLLLIVGRDRVYCRLSLVAALILRCLLLVAAANHSTSQCQIHFSFLVVAGYHAILVELAKLAGVRVEVGVLSHAFC